MELTAEEIRVLGVLIEKEATTPDQYPLSTNALTNACNQKTSRDPVVSYDHRTVSQTMLLLRPAGLARTVISGRTEKHRHVLHEAWNLNHAQLAVLAVLMLRGAQSPGELRTRTERAHGFNSLDDLHDVLDSLAARDEPLVRNIGRAPGQSQDRWIHLLGDETASSSPPVWSGPPTGDSAPVSAAPASAAGSSTEPSRPAPDGPSDTVAALERRVADLEARINALEAELGL